MKTTMPTPDCELSHLDKDFYGEDASKDIVKVVEDFVTFTARLQRVFSC